MTGSVTAILALLIKSRLDSKRAQKIEYRTELEVARQIHKVRVVQSNTECLSHRLIITVSITAITACKTRSV